MRHVLLDAAQPGYESLSDHRRRLASVVADLCIILYTCKAKATHRNASSWLVHHCEAFEISVPSVQVQHMRSLKSSKGRVAWKR